MQRWVAGLACIFVLSLLIGISGSSSDVRFALGLSIFASFGLLVRFLAGQLADRVLTPPPAPRIEASEFVTQRLREVDPDFDPDLFMERMERALSEVVSAFEAGSADRVAHFISDALYEQLRRAIAVRAQEERRSSGVIVRNMGYAHLRTKGRFDALTIAVDLERNWVESGSAPKARRTSDSYDFTAVDGFWTLVRRRGAKTKSSSGLIEGYCPNCESPVSITLNARCDACGSALRGGQYDWVISEITAGAEWRGVPSSRAPGIAEFAEQDPGFSVQHLEDRAAVLFWRLFDAERSRSNRSSEIVNGSGDVPVFLTRRSSCLHHDPRVESVYAHGLRRGDDFDSALVEVSWSSLIVMDGAPHIRGVHRTVAAILFVLRRRAGVKSPDGLDLTSAHCAKCGAPEGQRVATTCQFCGAALADGSQSWISFEQHESGSTRGRERLKSYRETDENGWKDKKP